jgi:hypothetical protein
VLINRVPVGSVWRGAVGARMANKFRSDIVSRGAPVDYASAAC